MSLKCSFFLVFWLSQTISFAQTTPTTPDDIKRVIDRVFAYANSATPFGLVNRKTGNAITNFKQPDIDASIVKGEFNIATHEWGLAYSGMLMAADVTGEKKFSEYVSQRLGFLGDAAVYFRSYKKLFPNEHHPLEFFLEPHLLDDTGSMNAAIIQALRAGITNDLRPEADRSIDFIMNKVYRLPDGTFGRNGPMPNSVWVDDLYQGIPALAQYGKLTGDHKYFDEATRQVSLILDKVFVKEKGVSMHGWIMDMEPHPQFLWARANGWAVMALVSLLEVLPEDHAGRKTVLDYYKAYCIGLARHQSASGFWHQLVDRNDSFQETSATAMFTYVLAQGVNNGWLDVRVYGPVALLGWNAVSSKVNEKGQVSGTTAGTGIAFDAAFYYNRPVGTGPHGYGSVMLAGAAMYKLLKEHTYESKGPVIFKK